jgi:opacity protein-like surface antigen
MIVPAIAALFLCYNAANGMDSDEAAPLISHMVYGQLILDTDDLDYEDEDYSVNLVGYDTQQCHGGDTLKYGLEGGALLSWESDVRSIVVTGGGGGAKVAVSADTSALLIDIFFGGYLSYEPSQRVRIYAGAGPLFLWGRRETDTLTTDDETVESDSESGIGVGIYGRAGFDLMFQENMGLTIGARFSQTSLSFEDPAGEVDVEGWEYYAGFVFRH